MLLRLLTKRRFSGASGQLVTILRRADYEKQLWKNGLGYTHEIAICKSKSKDAPFTWRLSMADLTPVQDGPFSQMCQVDRTILLLRGDCSIEVNGAPAVALQPFQPFSFPGDVPTVSTVLHNGRDLNCMVDRNNCSSAVHVIAAGERPVPMQLKQGDILFVTALGGPSAFALGKCSREESFVLDKEDTLRYDITSPGGKTHLTVSAGRVVAFIISRLNNV